MKLKVIKKIFNKTHLILDFLRTHRILIKWKIQTKNIWEGHYKNYKNIQVKGKGFNGDYWINKSLESTQKTIELSKSYGTIPTGVIGEHNLLPLLASTIYKDKGQITVLDFGGGCGTGYVHLTNSLSGCKNLSYYIIETKEICKIGDQLFENDNRIHFSTSVPDNLVDIDIIYMNSVLQYIENYELLIKNFCALHPKYFFFVKLTAGDIPTYATAQRNVPGSIIPYWFINVNEIINIMLKEDYVLIYKGALEKDYDQSNFPASDQIKKMCNLLFSSK